MSKDQLTESRLREIIKEEYINENFEMIMESADLFEAKGGTTNAASALGDAIDLLETKAGRRLIGQVFRIPYVFNKIPERIPYVLSGTTLQKDKELGFKKFMGTIGWLGSGIFKVITKPLAMIGDKIRDMDDDTAKIIVGIIRGKVPEGGGAEEGAEEPAEVEAGSKKDDLEVGKEYQYRTAAGSLRIIRITDLLDDQPNHVQVVRIKDDKPVGSNFSAKLDGIIV